MKLSIVAVAVLAGSLAMPAFAQDKAATEAPKADTRKAQAKGKPYSHLKEKTGIRPYFTALPKHSEEKTSIAGMPRIAARI